MGTTTKMAIPYPEATGLVKDGWEDMKDIATQVDAKSGLVLINSTTFTSVTSQSLNNVFSANYKNYRVLINLTSSTSDFNYLRLRASGTDNTTASSYISERFRATGTTLTGLRATDSYLLIGSQENAEYVSLILDIFSPFEARPTQFIVAKTERDTDADTEYNAFGGFHNQSTSYDGFTYYGTKSSSGTIRVYGYNE